LKAKSTAEEFQNNQSEKHKKHGNEPQLPFTLVVFLHSGFQGNQLRRGGVTNSTPNDRDILTLLRDE
jgi:hypothetical protein